LKQSNSLKIETTQQNKINLNINQNKRKLIDENFITESKTQLVLEVRKEMFMFVCFVFIRVCLCLLLI